MDVEKFLELMKTRIKSGLLDIVPTEKNRNTRRLLGLTVCDVEDSLLSLTKFDLHKGPIIDRDFPCDELFVFKTQVCGNLIYIKTKLDKDIVKCLSFHIDGE